MAGSFDDHLLARLRGQLSRGDVVLFTGAGFSRAARSTTGDAVPSVRELAEHLWQIAFPGQAFDEASTLGDIYEAAIRVARNRTRELMLRLLKVDAASLPETYRLWFSMPWARVYTLNIDDLDEAVQRQFTLPRPMRSVSALSSPLPGTDEALWVIHLNGTIGDFPDMTFSQRQYGERTARPDPWYSHLVSDLSGRPVLFVGTQLDEPPLWQHVELRRSRGAGRELRPGSLLVTPHLSVARQTILQEFNVQWVEMDAEAFAGEVLETLREEGDHGLRSLVRRREERKGERALQRVADARNEPATVDLTDFLMGREPSWADLVSGYAVKREFEDDLRHQIEESRARIALLTGTAGSGKSTTILRLALEWQAAGREVFSLDLKTEGSLRVLREHVKKSKADVLVIDDVDELGHMATTFVSWLLGDNPELVILAGVRGTRYEALEMDHAFDDHGAFQFTIPHLQDPDIDLLIDALDRGNRLGRLKGQPREQQVRAFRDRAGRQLIVAMIEATSGERFEDKINRECGELDLDLALIYAMAAIATSFRHYLRREEILVASGAPDNETLNRLEALIRQRLLVVGNGQIRVRHRVIADEVLNYYRRQGQLKEPLRGLLFSIATQVRPETQWRSREKQFAIRLLNHDLLLRLAESIEAVRAAYEEVENVLNWDYHYWLQRGSLEVETGNLNWAENFLEQARSMAPTDPKVQTEWAYMVLKKATQEAAAPDAPERAEAAIAALEEAIEARGRVDPYPFHILGSQGLSWSRRAAIIRDDRIRLLRRLLDVVKQGSSLHPHNRELRTLVRDVEQEYLMMGVKEPSGEEQP